MKPMHNHAVHYIKRHDLGGTPRKMHSTAYLEWDIIFRQSVSTD